MQQEGDTFFIYEIDSKHNYDLFPLIINDSEIINLTSNEYDFCRCERSQYSLEVTLHNLFKQHNKRSYNYENSNVVFIPFYVFLSAWKTKYFYSVQDIINGLREITPLIKKILKDGKKIILVYSDVMWEDERCFINHFDFGDDVYFVCYETVPNDNKQIPLPYCTHIKCEPSQYIIPYKSEKEHLISYAGRVRPELKYFTNIKILNTYKTNDIHWISSNNKVLYNDIDNLYLNSYFSLQPHGDKQTRKGFYHSMLLGAVPVIFENNYQTYESVFRGLVNIEDISVILKESDKNYFEDILRIEIKDIESKIKNIEKIKSLLLYDDMNSEIVNHILNRVINYHG